MARNVKRQKKAGKNEQINVLMSCKITVDRAAIKAKCDLESCMKIATGFGRVLDEELKYNFPRYIEQEFMIYEKMLEHSIQHSAQASVNCELIENVTANISESLLRFASPAASNLNLKQQKLTPIKVVDIEFFRTGGGLRFATTTPKLNNFASENSNSNSKNNNNNKNNFNKNNNVLSTIKESFEESCRVKLAAENNFKSVSGSVADVLLEEDENEKTDSVLNSFANDFKNVKIALENIKKPQTFKAALKKAVKNAPAKVVNNVNNARERLEKAMSRKEERMQKIKNNMNSKTNSRLEANAKRREQVKKNDYSGVLVNNVKPPKNESVSRLLVKPQIFSNESLIKKNSITTSTPFVAVNQREVELNKTVEIMSDKENESVNDDYSVVSKKNSLRKNLHNNSTLYSYDKDYEITQMRDFDVTPSDDWYEYEARMAEKAPRWACDRNVERMVRAQYENPALRGEDVFGSFIDLKPISRAISDNRKRQNVNKSL